MFEQYQLLESLVKKCLVDNGVSTDQALVEKVAKIFQKSGKRVLTAALQTQLQSLGIKTAPEPVTHDMVVQASTKKRDTITLTNCANAFVAGLAIELAALRAPLRALAVVAHFPKHKAKTSANWFDPDYCSVCGYSPGLLPGSYSSVSNLSGLMISGIHGRVDDAYPAAQTLDWFATLPPITPTREQVGRFEYVLKVIADALAKATCNSLHKDLSDTLGGDKYNRLYVIETLGYCGVLNTKLGTPLLDKWLNRKKIEEHPNKFNEAESPACFWKREFGFNGARFRELFPTVKLPARLDGPML